MIPGGLLLVNYAVKQAPSTITKDEAVMSSGNAEPVARQYTSMDRGTHSLHESRGPQDFCQRFEVATGRSVQQVVDKVISSTAPRAVFVAGSLPLGMATSGSDVDLIVLVDSNAVLVNGESHIANNAQQLEFHNQNDALLAGIFLSMNEGVLVDLHVALTPTIHGIYRRLRGRGPELNETEIRTLGRINTGWLLWQSEGYLERNPEVLRDPALDVYCCTKHFVSALHEIAKAHRAVGCTDFTLALQLGRLAVELAYLAYFASEGMPYLGSKWLAQIGHARGAAERVRRHPLLQEGSRLLFPVYTSNSRETNGYLQAVAEFLTAMRNLMEQKTLFRIAFQACPQVHPL